MPCQSDWEGEYDNLLKELNKVTRLLCEACQLLKNPDQTDRMSEELYSWYSEHEKKDKERDDKIKGEGI